MNSDYYLGIDGGGTKTAAVLLDSEQSEIARAVSGSANVFAVGPAVAKDSLCEAIGQVLSAARLAPVEVTTAGLVLAGAGRSDEQQAARELLANIAPLERVVVTHDAEAALVGGLGSSHRTLVRNGAVLITGGDAALRRSVEGAEDDGEAGASAVREAGVRAHDVVVGITASGGAAWVLGAVGEARQRGPLGLTCHPDSSLARAVEVVIAPVVGPEVIAGSSRMKAGTAQKMVLNMLSTAAMIRLGKVYGNLMVDVQPSSAKLRQRAIRILQEASRVDEAEAGRALEATGCEVKPALVMLLAEVALARRGSG